MQNKSAIDTHYTYANHQQPFRQNLCSLASDPLFNDYKSTNPTCFLNLKTLNLSKSVNAFLFSLWSLLFAHVLSSHFFCTSLFSHAFATAPLPAARGSFGITMGVRMRFPSETAWRGTEALGLVEGPSTRTYGELILGRGWRDKRTLWEEKTRRKRNERACGQLSQRWRQSVL